MIRESGLTIIELELARISSHTFYLAKQLTEGGNTCINLIKHRIILKCLPYNLAFSGVWNCHPV